MICTTFARKGRPRANARRRPLPRSRPPGVRAVLPSAAALVLLVALVGCAEDGSDRRFANDPVPTSDRATVVPSPEPPVPPSVLAPAPPASPEALLVGRGAPHHLYFLADGALWTLAAETDGPVRIFAPDGGEIRAFAPSPSGDRVALLLAPASDDGATDLRILAADGAERRRADAIQRALGAPAGTVPRARSLQWSPQGDRLVAAFEAGGVLGIPVEGGDPTLLVAAADAPFADDAAWSPSGSAVAYRSPVAADVAADLWVLATATGAGTAAAPSAPARVVAASDQGRSVTGLAWLPDGSALLVAERAAPGAPPLAGGLVAVRPDGRDPRVVASAGRVAPVAEIDHFAPSPDGRSVAYSVSVPSPDGPAFHSLWLRPLAGGQALPLAVPPNESVTDLWWTPSGLVFRAVPFAPGVTAYAGGPFALYRATASDAPERLFATDAGTPAASPGAGSPLPATPPASPVARSRSIRPRRRFR